MGSPATMLEIAESFVALTESKPPEKISVSDIIAQAGKNRKTFYYHFTDKNHLIAWTFRYDLACELHRRFDAGQLVFEQPDDDPCASLPYYVFIKKGVRSLDGSEFFEALAACFEGRRAYYARVLRMSEAGCLRDYLYDLYLPAVRADITFVLSNRRLKDASVDFLAEFYTGAFLSYLVRRTCDLHRVRLMEGVGPFANIVHSSLENEIKEQQLRRML